MALALPAVLLAGVNDKSYDCQLRELAHAYTADVVLGERVGWSTARRANALALVDHGLKLGECNSSSSRRSSWGKMRRRYQHRLAVAVLVSLVPAEDAQSHPAL